MRITPKFLKIAILAGSLSTIAGITVGSYKTAPADVHSQAEAKKFKGLYIFIYSEPTAPYEVLGTEKCGAIVWKNTPEGIFKVMTNKIAKDYPRADAIIFDNIDLENATAIKFK